MSNFSMPEPGHTGSVFLGSAYGNFTRDGRSYKYANIFVATPVAVNPAEGRYGIGWRTDKHRCESEKVFQGLEVGDNVQLYFDQYQRVVEAVLIDSQEP